MNRKNGELPGGWIRVRLGDITSPSSERVEPGHWAEEPYLSLEHIESGTRRILGRGTGADVSSTKNRFRAGDVLYGKLRPYLNKVCIPDFDGICSTDILVLPQNRAVHNRFLLYFLSRPEFVEYATQNASGINLPRISFEKLSELEVELPPLSEQRRIVAKIEELQARTRCAHEALEVIPQLIEKFRQSVLAATFRGDLTANWRARNPDIELTSVLLERIRAERRQQWEAAQLAKMRANRKEPRDDSWKQGYEDPAPIDASELPQLPEGWEWISVEELASREPRSIQSGPFGSNLLHSEFQDTGILAIGIDNVHQSGFSLGNQNRIRPEKYQELIKYSARPLDVLITVMASVGRTCVVPADLEPAIITKHVYRITTDQQLINPHLLVFALQGSEAILAQVSAGIRGQTRPGINGAILKSLAVPVPPREEQEQIVTFISSLLDRFRPLMDLIAEAKERTESLDQSILAKALRGELVPQDPNDEPASVLLERTRAKKAMDTRPRSRNHMRKQSAVRSSKKRRPILEVLNRSQEPLTPEELFARCGRNPLVIEDIEGFFSELRELEKMEQLEEVRPNDATVLLRTVS